MNLNPNAPTPQNAPPAPAPAGGRTLRVIGLGHQYNPNWWCIREIELEFRLGELVGLVGPNGSGKTTLMRALAGQLRPTAGEVRYRGRPLARYSSAELARSIGYLPQSVRSSFNYTCEEVIAQGRYPHQNALGILTRRDREAIERVMDWTTTRAFAHRPIDVLSGGERQRVLLASVLAQEAEFLLLDEPTSALDLHHQVDVFERLHQLSRTGLGLIVITHDLNLAAQYCDRLVLIFEGRVAAAGAPGEVLREEVLRRVYETDLIVDRNPVIGTPMVVLLGRHGAQLARRHNGGGGA
ncbi:MAG: ABC transporter ATP-binding protein [bacterium]|nr:ABC transporter ATP-binding protein [bacterium]